MVRSEDLTGVKELVKELVRFYNLTQVDGLIIGVLQLGDRGRTQVRSEALNGARR